MFLLAKCVYCTCSFFRNLHVDSSPTSDNCLAAAPQSAFLPRKSIHSLPSPSMFFLSLFSYLASSHLWAECSWVHYSKAFLDQPLMGKCLCLLPVHSFCFPSKHLSCVLLLNTQRKKWPLQYITRSRYKNGSLGLGCFPGGSVVKNPPANAGDMGWIPDLGTSHIPWRN